ncbi:amidohydrolase family protein [Novosphingobium kaempferiae]|uniref:amidohydrolase family protein n=1 Tax=Novosphingobium kaempferiae TaxID=2896849 RepID=UPI001E56F657|nr:amidohydrolase family protein [Novosphingobium kaempferiae]
MASARVDHTPSTRVSIPEMVGIGFPCDRELQRDSLPFPAGTRLISSDSHWLETGDVWTSRFPEHLRDKAPKVVRTPKGWNIEVGGRMRFPDIITEAQDTFECLPGMSEVEARLADLDAEGVEKELLFPQKVLSLIREADLEARAWVFRGYNQYIASICAQAPDRLYGVGIANFWDPDAFESSIEEIRALGLKAIMAPIMPGQRPDGTDILYASPEMDPFWSAVEKSVLPFCFHIGEAVKIDSFGGLGAHFLSQTGGFRLNWGALTFGGVFDRHPALKVVFVEAGINWVAGAIQDADLAYEAFHPLMTPQLRHTPSWYWFNHCYATFMTDAAGLALLDFIGADRVMWSTDYPHNESTVGYTRSAAHAVFAATSEDNAKKIVGETALDVFDMR